MSVGVALWAIVTHFQSDRSAVEKYGFDACSKQVGEAENGNRGVNPRRRWNSSDVPLKEPVAAAVQAMLPPNPVPAVAGA